MIRPAALGPSINVAAAHRSDRLHPAGRSVERRALWFTGAIFAVSLMLQRFGLPFGGKSVSLVGPLGMGLVAYGLANGALCFHRARLLTYVALVACVLAGMAWHAVEARDLGDSTSLPSLLQFLLLTAFATVTFAEPVDEGAFFRRVNFALLLVAVAGILQFAAQFAGLSLFAFTGLLPDSLLYEAGYHLIIPVGVGEIMKSNGLVLVEPSVLSQLMAIALVIEAVAFRRPLYLAAFIGGLLLSFSGTGWIVLGAFVFSSAIAMGKRGLLIAVGVILLLAAAIGAAMIVAPEIMASVSGRLLELQDPSSSGHLRFITPFWILSDVLSATPSALLIGIGSGGSERLVLSYEFAVNTPVKVMLEYGTPVLLAYLLLFCLGRKTPVQAAVLLPAIVLFMFTGGYQQFPPMIFIVLMLTAVARLRVPPPQGS